MSVIFLEAHTIHTLLLSDGRQKKDYHYSSPLIQRNPYGATLPHLV
jgi:hypothetical protein